MDAAGSAPATQVRTGARRWFWFGAGWCSVGVGGVGVVVPGLPTTVFFIVAASCFAKSSPRFERWVLELPRIGPMVRDHRAGLGMRPKAKAWAIGTMVLFAGVSALVLVAHVVMSAAILALVAIGVWYVGWRVPTRRTARALPGEQTGTRAYR